MIAFCSDYSVMNVPTIDLNSTARSRIILVPFKGNRTLSFELYLVEVERTVPGELTLVLACRFRAPETTKDRITACDIVLSFSTPSLPAPLFITAPLTIEAPPSEEVQVMYTKSAKASIGAGMSYLASLRARLSLASTKRYSVLEKETREVMNWGDGEIKLGFSENGGLKRGLKGERRVRIHMESVEGVSRIDATFGALFRSTAARSFGFSSSHLDRFNATFTLIL